jgi:probable H4MPT-linked C1 transfer pathway protein
VTTSAVVGWDLGGAHLKAARVSGSGRVDRVVQRPCPLWQGMTHFFSALDEVLEATGRAPSHAVTMTGEMVDLFSTRGEGVATLVAAMRDRLPGAELRFFAGRDGWVDAEGATRSPMRVASANWMASAALVADRIEEGLLVDIGSTTTDLVPVSRGMVRAVGHDDASRLVAGELVYTGVVRTPLMAVAERVPFQGQSIPLVAEYFATAADLHRILGTLPETADQYPAADGGPKTVEASARRLARMIGRDLDSAPLGEWRELARALAGAQCRRIDEGCDAVIERSGLSPGSPLVAAGVGRFLVPGLAAAAGRPVVEFGSLIPVEPAVQSLVADCAPAAAVAWLAARRSG